MQIDKIVPAADVDCGFGVEGGEAVGEALADHTGGVVGAEAGEGEDAFYAEDDFVLVLQVFGEVVV